MTNEEDNSPILTHAFIHNSIKSTWPGVDRQAVYRLSSQQFIHLCQKCRIFYPATTDWFYMMERPSGTTYRCKACQRDSVRGVATPRTSFVKVCESCLDWKYSTEFKRSTAKRCTTCNTHREAARSAASGVTFRSD